MHNLGRVSVRNFAFVCFKTRFERDEIYMKNLKLTFCNNLFVYTKVGENNVFLLYWSDKIVSLSL